MYHPSTHLFSRAEIRDGRIVELRCHRLPGGMSSTETIVHDLQEVMVMARFKSAYRNLVPRCWHTRVEGPPDWLPSLSSARSDVGGNERTNTPDASERTNAGGVPARGQPHGIPQSPLEGSLVGLEPTPEQHLEPVFYQQKADHVTPRLHPIHDGGLP